MKNEEIINKLKSPFEFEDIEWKIKILNSDKTRGLAWAYIDSRAIQNRLDEVVGSYNWKNEFMLWQDKAQVCGISLFDAERNMWVTKYDGAGNTDNEPIKGGLSGAFKRAAVHWGIGRYLYEFPDTIWVDIEMQGKGAKIKRSEYSKLRDYYNEQLRLIDKGVKDINNNPSSSPQNTEKNDESKTKEMHQVYKITEVAKSNNSIRVNLLAEDGKEFKVFARKENEDLRLGAFLSNLKLEKKVSNFGAYYTVTDYEIVA